MWVLWATVNNILWCYAMEDDCCANVEELSHIWAGLDVPYVPRYHTSDYQLADWAKYLIRSKTFFFFFLNGHVSASLLFKAQTIFRSRSLDETYFSQSHTQLCKWWQLIVPKTGLEMMAEKRFHRRLSWIFHFLWPGSRSDDAFSSWWWNQRTKKGVYFSTSNSEHISTPWCLSKLVIWNAIAKKQTNKKPLWIVLYRAINSVVLVANLDHCKQGLFWNLIWKLESVQKSELYHYEKCL